MFKPGKVTLHSSAAQPLHRKSVDVLHYSEINIHTPKLKDIMKKKQLQSLLKKCIFLKIGLNMSHDHRDLSCQN